MIRQPSKDIEIPYLGRRDYIDMSQILKTVMDDLSSGVDIFQLRDIELVMRRPTQTHLRLSYGPSGIEEKKTEVFSFRANSPSGLIEVSAQSLPRPISSRIAETVDDASPYVKVENDMVTRLRPVGGEALDPEGGAFFYDGMKTIKILLLEKFKPSFLRVVRFASERNVILKDTDVLQGKFQSRRKSFVDCTVLVNGRKVSDVRVYMKI